MFFIVLYRPDCLEECNVGHGLSVYYYGYAQIGNNIILLYLSHSGYRMWIKLYYITLQFLAPPIIAEYNILLLREVTHWSFLIYVLLILACLIVGLLQAGLVQYTREKPS